MKINNVALRFVEVSFAFWKYRRAYRENKIHPELSRSCKLCYRVAWKQRRVWPSAIGAAYRYCTPGMIPTNRAVIKYRSSIHQIAPYTYRGITQREIERNRGGIVDVRTAEDVRR